MDYLKSLNVIVERLLGDPSIKETIEALKVELHRSRESFVWRSINTRSVKDILPKNIKQS